MNLHREIRVKAMLAIISIIAALNANAQKLYIVYRMIF